MTDYQKYYDARKTIQEIIKADLLGPMPDQEEEIINIKYPTNYYIVGKLYPQNQATQMVLENDNAEELTEVKASDDKLLDSGYSGKESIPEPSDEIGGCNLLNPSAMGITFAVPDNIKQCNVALSYAVYEQISAEDALKANYRVDEANPSLWKRCPVNQNFIFDLNFTGSTRKSVNGIAEFVLIHHKKSKRDKNIERYTLSLKNIQSKKENKPEEEAKKTIFQPKITINLPDNTAFNPVERTLDLQIDKDKNKEKYEAFKDDLVMELLYSKVKSYAQGHGCAVSWNDNHTMISTDFLPEEEILQLRPASSKDFKNFDDKILDMEYLSQASGKDIAKTIRNFCKIYENWIKEKNNLILTIDKHLQDVAKDNLSECNTSLKRILRAADLIESDENVKNAFCYANEAMLEQYKAQCKAKNEEYKPRPWYPFQVAFILQELESIANPKSDDRKITDLLWFPTGGGKTEAYLGLAAFTIFLRHLKYPNCKGVTVLTRYTYRLLTFQQFQRTLRLICACELLRKKYNISNEKISIGLWIGEDQTPNKIADARNYINNKDNKSKGNPVQITKCPWCGAKISKSNYTFDDKKMHIHCSNPECEFSKGDGIPAAVIDEQIYNNPPTFIVATVDKFAQIPQIADAGKIFGYLENGKRLLPPDLIIQDELHLLTGPIGTIIGLYESGFKKLCETNNEYGLKVISSTATIRNAKSQIKCLYKSNYHQFPAQGLDIDDSFFAKKSERDEKASRMYMGCMAVGTTPITMMVRVMSIIYFATRYIKQSCDYDKDVKDAFFTLTGYFNTLRELGGANIRVTDDINARVKFLAKKYKDKYPYEKDSSIQAPKELTSRISGSDIEKTLKEIEEKFLVDFVLATNMISVGVDIDRLGTMIVVGQPKMTAEYIQSTSRVGRKNPGLVVTTYNQAKSRDRSHFEQFKQYHQSFYKFVEATTLTPFSNRARARALHTVYVMLATFVNKETNEKRECHLKDKQYRFLENLITLGKNHSDGICIADIARAMSENINNIPNVVKHARSQLKVGLRLIPFSNNSRISSLFFQLRGQCIYLQPNFEFKIEN